MFEHIFIIVYNEFSSVRNVNNHIDIRVSNLLRTINIQDDNLFRRCFDFLFSHPSYTRRLLGMSIQYRLNRLLTYLSERNSL